MTSSDSYLCLAFSQAGPDLGGCGPMNCAHNNWQLKDLNLNITRDDTATSGVGSTTTLSLFSSTTNTLEGEQITFTGALIDSSSGAGLSGKNITLYEWDPDPSGNSNGINTTLAFTETDFRLAPKVAHVRDRQA